ncbi:hypothetical protein AB0C02_21845 [Micromonospora sp. NPDC048999]|uniref:hypothetical protein n=1 Tax=Micromonospora sp. NPDC048999 TaxID=3155391 RepID=UPI0033CFA364
MERLTEIAFRLPRTPESAAFLGQLRTLLAGVAYAESVRAPGGAVERLTLTPPRPSGARPLTIFELADTPTPAVAFDTGPYLGVEGDVLPDVLPTVDLAELTRRLAGHVRRVDHTGVNLPGRTTSPEQWRDLLLALASTSTLYRYPTGEEWPFILPSTPDELRGNIRDFVVGREPRFELVYEEWRTRTEWQFALWTDLTRAELELLFPEPEGITFPGLDEIFRVVPVNHPWWPEVSIRFDLCYRIEGGPTDWETGEWLVTAGGRIR